MAKALDLDKCYMGLICSKHPDLNGLRQKANATCIQCGRDAQNRRSEAKRLAEGREKFVPMSREQAAARIRERNKARSAQRRMCAKYNAEQIERKKAWRQENKEHHLATSRAYEAKQRAENLQRRISKNLRNRLSKAMMGKTRGASAVRDLGISIEEFRAYIASKFQPGMSWENYGEWHLDHIQPLRLFDLTDEAEARRACHYTNLQPLWALDNQKKWCKPHAHAWPDNHAAARKAVGV